jgi:hypothetical protein
MNFSLRIVVSSARQLVQCKEMKPTRFASALPRGCYSIRSVWIGLDCVRHNDAIIRHLKAGDALIFNDHVLHGSAARLNPGA